MVRGDLIEGDNNGRVFLCGGYMIANGRFCSLRHHASGGGQFRERCHVLLLDDNVVGEMMHHETLCLTGRGVAGRDMMSCCEMAMLWRQT